MSTFTHGVRQEAGSPALWAELDELRRRQALILAALLVLIDALHPACRRPGDVLSAVIALATEEQHT